MKEPGRGSIGSVRGFAVSFPTSVTPAGAKVLMRSAAGLKRSRLKASQRYDAVARPDPHRPVMGDARLRRGVAGLARLAQDQLVKMGVVLALVVAIVGLV
jgi:hypothetical protein